MTAITDWTKTADFPVSPLMVYPMGAAAAATAIGFGMAGQMTGLMIGAMQGAMQSQAQLLGRHPDLSWIVPTLAEDLAPDEAEAQVLAPVAAAATASADVVAFKPVDEAKPAEPVKARAKPAPAKAAPATARKAEAPAAPEKNAAVLEKLKSDAEVAAAGASEPAPAARKAKVRSGTALEPEDYRRPAEMEKPESPDDLKLISGIGPKLEQVLNGLGVFTFAQIAAWQPEEVAWVDDYLQFSGRIDRDDWISQAGALAKGAPDAG
ncbi:hypothetical protein LL06_00435 [Hoeflea sp. BAL378]|uniref:hypothetical protein n=1 Tax=Hoeflea sp. BAL378 TaxID=1547437 RepID=UPI00051425FC|nr:hypothetical protein [Hoeflea sp. BAL378]KGF71296.1 hypothetical protein LL06_00435 [Hoeflea sp. BAL378]